MPSEYRSNPGGLYNSGVMPNSRPQIDLGGILDAVGSGAGSIIHAVMQRKQAENQAKMQQAEFALHQQSQQRQNEHDAWQRDFDERKFKEQQAVQGRQDALAGYVPGATKTVADTVPTGESMSIQPVSPIRRALTPQASSAPGTMPGPQLTPSAEPTTPAASVPVVRDEPTTVSTPATVDLSKNVTYAKTIDAANARATAAETRLEERTRSQAELQKQRLDAQQAGREYAAKMAGQRQSAAIAARANGPIKGAMTDGQKDKKAVDSAAGFLAAHAGGTYDDALRTFNETDEGKALQGTGITEDHLLRAYGKMKRDPTTGQILGLLTSGAAKDAGDAVVKLKGAKDAAKSVNTPPFKADSTGLPPTKRLVAPGTKSAAKADESTMSDADLWEAKVAAGMSKPEATTYVQKRKKKP